MKPKLFALAVIFWLAILLVAHSFPPPGYVWTQNTVSELASQGHTYKWIMQAGLTGFGALMILAVGWHGFQAKEMIYPLVPVALYGLAIFLSGIYCTAPIDPTIPYSVREAKLHSLFASLAGLSLSLAIFWRIFISANSSEKWAHIIFLVMVLGLSALFGLAENDVIGLGKGVVQRILHLSSFAWLIYQENLLAGRDKITALPGMKIRFTQ